MNRYQITWILAIILLFAVIANAQGGNLYVKINSENLRTEPSGDKIGTLSSGTQVEVLERRPNWVKVQLTGWIWEQSLTSDPTRVDGFQLGASHILLKTEAEAQQVLKELKSGKSFSEMAKLFSQDKASATKGGSLGNFKRGDLLPPFEDAAIKLNVGEISGVVKTALGYHIIRRDQ